MKKKKEEKKLWKKILTLNMGMNFHCISLTTENKSQLH